MRPGKPRRWGEGARSRFGAWRVMPALQTAARKRGSIWQAVTALQNKKVPNCRFSLLNGGLRRFCKCSWRGRTVLQESLAANDGFAKRMGGKLFANPSLAAMRARISRGEALPICKSVTACHGGPRFRLQAAGSEQIGESASLGSIPEPTNPCRSQVAACLVAGSAALAIGTSRGRSLRRSPRALAVRGKQIGPCRSAS